MEKEYWKMYKLANHYLVKSIGLLEKTMIEKLKSLGLTLEERSYFNVSYCGGFETEITYKGEAFLVHFSMEDLLEMETSEELWERVNGFGNI